MATPRKQQQQQQPQQQPQGAVSVQHVAKASSDELLRKFADPDARHLAATTTTPPPRRSLALRRKRSSRRVASGLSARENPDAAGELAAPKRRRSIGGGSSDWRAGLLQLPTTRKGQARRGGGAARLDDAAGIGLILAALERVSPAAARAAIYIVSRAHPHSSYVFSLFFV